MAAAPVLHQENLVIYELLGSGDSQKIESFLRLYENNFPQYVQYIPRMRRRAAFSSDWNPRFRTHYWLVEVGGQPAGFCAFRYVHARRLGLGHALAVDSAYNGYLVNGVRLSVFIVRQCLRQLMEDAQAVGDVLHGIVNEVESPRLMNYYKRNGFIELPVVYQEPVFPSSDAGPEDATFQPMRLAYLPAGTTPPTLPPTEVLIHCILAFLVDHYGLPETHPVVQAAINSIRTERDGS